MPIQIIRPTSYVTGAFVTATGATLPTAVGDQSDSTFIRRRAAGSPMLVAACTFPALSDARYDIATIIPGMRTAKSASSKTSELVQLAIGNIIYGQVRLAPWYYPLTMGATVDEDPGASGGQPAQANGDPWTKGNTVAIAVNDLQTRSAYYATVYELYAKVYTAYQPDCSLAVTPASPDTTTSYPTVTGTVQALIEAWQDGLSQVTSRAVQVDLRVFSEAQYTAASFDPWKAVPLYSSLTTVDLAYIDGVTKSAALVQLTPTTPLNNGAYKVYMRARRTFPNAQWAIVSAWAGFTVQVPQPTPPTITSQILSSPKEPNIVVTIDPALVSPVVTVQRNDSDALDPDAWPDVRGGSAVALSGTGLDLIDYEAKRNSGIWVSDLRYRARVEATSGGARRVSDWSYAADLPPIPADGWNLKCPLDPTLNMIGISVLKDPDHTKNEDTQVFRPIGRTYPVVSSLSLGGWDGSMKIALFSEYEWWCLQRILDYRGTLYLESPFGWSRYIRITGRTMSEVGSAGAKQRIASVEYLEVGCP